MHSTLIYKNMSMTCKSYVWKSCWVNKTDFTIFLMLKNIAKNCDIVATNLNVSHNYFDGRTQIGRRIILEWNRPFSVRSDENVRPPIAVVADEQTDAGVSAQRRRLVSASRRAAFHLWGQHSRTNFSHDIAREGVAPLTGEHKETPRYIEWQRKRLGDAAARRDAPATNFWRTRVVARCFSSCHDAKRLSQRTRKVIAETKYRFGSFPK